MARQRLRALLDSLTAPELQRAQRTRQTVAAVTSVLLALTALAVDASTPLGIASGVLFTGIILLTLWLPSANPVIVAGITSAVTLVGLLKTQTVAPEWAVAANRFLSIAVQLAAAFLVAVHRKQERERAALIERVDQGLRQVRLLEGLVPICAWCKRIRDESGNWQSLEIYLHDRSDADFTHGACPTCAEKLMQDAREASKR